MKNKCLSCKEMLPDMNTLVLSDRRKGLEGTWNMNACPECGVIAIHPLPTESQLSEYYAAYYQGEKVDLLQQVGGRKKRSSWLRKCFHGLTGDVDARDFVQVPSGGRVLDYGCGYAGALSFFHDAGVNISGAEIDKDVVVACQKNGYDVHQVNDFSHIPFDNKTFDVVYLMQVFEHLRDPHQFMGELSRILKQGGALYIAVPNAASIWRKVFSLNWVSGWFAPFHLFHYDRKNLSDLAKEYGFELEKAWSNTPVSWFRLNLKAWLFPNENKLDRFKCWLDGRLVGYALMFILRLIELPVRERDCLVVKLVKK